MEFLVLGIFCTFLILCIASEASIIYALLAGFVLFMGYGKSRGYSWKELGHMAFEGIYKVKNILITFVLIGMMTALWRAAGTIPAVICYTIRFIQPSVFLLMVFLLNCLVSVLTGTALGTAATIGVVCATMASALKISPWLTGGTILSGVYFGDRCSPVSTSALLVAELTETNIYQNIKTMIKSAAVPFVLSCILYGMISMRAGRSAELPNLVHRFSGQFVISWIALLPAVVILVLSVLQAGVKISMLASILTAVPVCVFTQGISWQELPQLLITGFHSGDAAMAAMLNGGGIVSMIKVGAIVCISSSYSGIFQETGILDRVQKIVEELAEKTFPFLAVFVTAVITSIVACNQTLAIMLTRQLCEKTEEDQKKMAGYLEDSAVVIAPLIPWSIACAVPLSAVGASEISILAAFFLYLLPVCECFAAFIRKKKNV